MVIGLRTVKGTKQLKLDPTIYDALQKEKVVPGDVIYIEANSGAAVAGAIPPSLHAGAVDSSLRSNDTQIGKGQLDCGIGLLCGG